MNPMVESAWIAAGAGAVGVIGTATVGIVGYFIARSTNREAITAAKATTDETIASARADAGKPGYFTLDSPATCERIRIACEDAFTAQFIAETK